MRPAPSSVFASLSASRARTAGALDLGSGRSAVVWRNDGGRISYDRPEGHTFSLYLEGGSGTRRVDGRPAAGWPGALCVMPQGCGSVWEVTAPFRFVHLYIAADDLRRAYAETFDRDARLLDLPEVTFADAPGPAAALDRVAQAVAAGDPLAAESAADDALASILAEPRWGRTGRMDLKGGLAPHLGRRVADYVEAHLDGPLTLADLAAVAGLSPFHLQRAFRASRGTSPHAFVAHRRAARAKALLRGRDPVAGIALACGFSSQSHMTRAFKAATGMTPADYRRRAAAHAVPDGPRAGAGFAGGAARARGASPGLFGRNPHQ